MLACVLNTPLHFEDSSNVLFLESISHYKALEICYFFKVLYFFYFIKHAILILLNTIPLTRTKTFVNNLLMSKY